jgi:hypothetical protein
VIIGTVKARLETPVETAVIETCCWHRVFRVEVAAAFGRGGASVGVAIAGCCSRRAASIARA